MHDAVARILSKYPQESVILVLEGENGGQGLMFSMLFVFMYIPMIALAAIRGTVYDAVFAGIGVAVIAVLMSWAMRTGASDMVVTVDGLHLFWRYLAKVEHVFVPAHSIRSVRLGPVYTSELLRSVNLELSTGKKLKLRLADSTKAGIVPRYKIVRNVSAHTFSGPGRNPNHTQAFKAVMDDLLLRS